MRITAHLIGEDAARCWTQGLAHGGGPGSVLYNQGGWCSVSAGLVAAGARALGYGPSKWFRNCASDQNHILKILTHTAN